VWITAGGLFVVPQACVRWVQQPHRAGVLAERRATLTALAARQAVDARAGETVRPEALRPLMDEVDERARTLRKSRWTRAGVLLGAAAGVPFGMPLLVEVTPWWVDGGALAGGVAGLLLLGRRYMRGDDLPGGAPVDDEVDVPEGLRLDDSDQGARATLKRALGELRARAQVGPARRGPGWGYDFPVRMAKALTVAQLDQLAHLLNVRRGGLLVLPDRASTQAYMVRTVLHDRIAEPVQPVQPPADVQPTDLARHGWCFDGDELTLGISKSALVLGATGSGKSATLRELLRWRIAAGAQVLGIDLMGGADLDVFAPAMQVTAFGYERLSVADRILQYLSALVVDRTERLRRSGLDHWTDELGGMWVLAVDEYHSLAQYAPLRRQVEALAMSGRKVMVKLLVANNRRTKDVMGSTALLSQVDVVVLHSMSAEDELGLPRDLREQGVRPATLRAADERSAHDAGKGYVLGARTEPVLARLPYTDKAGGRAVAEAHPAGPLHPEDQAVWDRFFGAGVDQGVAPLIMMIRDAILAAGAGRDPVRASVGEIAEYCRRHGEPIEREQVTARLTGLFGPDLRPMRRDMNLPDGTNPKGYRLSDFDDALTRLRASLKTEADGFFNG